MIIELEITKEEEQVLINDMDSGNYINRIDALLAAAPFFTQEEREEITEALYDCGFL